MTPPARPEQTTESRNDNATPRPNAPAVIEFPTPGRAPKPQWRKELSERVREIQQRKAQEAAREAEAHGEAHAGACAAPDAEPLSVADAAPASAATVEAQTPPLGLVPPQPAPALNPLVANALKRIERARQQQPTPQPARAGRGRHGATAAARVAREDYEVAPQHVAEQAPTRPLPAPHAEQSTTPQQQNVPAARQSAAPQQSPAPQQRAATTQRNAMTQTAAAPSNPATASPNAAAETHTSAGASVSSADARPSAESEMNAPGASESSPETPRPVNLVVVPPPVQAEAHAAAPAERAKTRRHIPLVLDEAYLARREAETAAAEAPDAPGADDRAPLVRRVAGGLVDLLVVAFAATPFAAIIELTNGNWADRRVAGAMAGIILVLLFLYLMASTALAGRTWGLALTGLRTADAATGRAPTTSQCARRAFGFMLALATGGLGLAYALLDAERRALHDHLSGTIVVRE
ncbi:MAG TPA: RDD family protein [Pyrinomonadaceae bacterium]|jgi:uncharacterized RDD family membrane protein YckC